MLLMQLEDILLMQVSKSPKDLPLNRLINLRNGLRITKLFLLTTLLLVPNLGKTQKR